MRRNRDLPRTPLRESSAIRRAIPILPPDGAARSRSRRSRTASSPSRPNRSSRRRRRRRHERAPARRRSRDRSQQGAAARSSDRAAQAADLVDRGVRRLLHHLLRLRQGDLRLPHRAAGGRARGPAQRSSDLHRALRNLLHLCEGGNVRRLCLAFPIIAAQIWMFIAPGLYRQERRAFLPFLLASPVLFIIGAAFVFYIMLPFAIRFFLGLRNARRRTARSASSFRPRSANISIS